MVTVPEDPRQAWVNLRAPLALNPYARMGRQVVLSDERFAFRHPLWEAISQERQFNQGRHQSQGGRLSCWSLPVSSTRASSSAIQSA
ncbi:MAG TPA: flagellar assembly protein FliW, partial [Firmicutes bacterium]|nr:flagellar assembly protein FliW [Bacillota bacterium]